MRQLKGFSTIELLVVIAILAILAIVGLPLMESAIASYRLSNAVQTISVAVQRARYLATSENKVYVLFVKGSRAANHPNSIRIAMDENWDFKPTTTAEKQSILWFSVGDKSKIVENAINFGSYSQIGNSKHYLVFEPNGKIRKPDGAQPPVDPTDNVPRPRLRLRTTVFGHTETMWVYFGRFGQVMVH